MAYVTGVILNLYKPFERAHFDINGNEMVGRKVYMIKESSFLLVHIREGYRKIINISFRKTKIK